MKDLRIVFMGTPDFAVGILKAMVAEQQNVVGVVTAPDKPAGRGRKLKAPAVKEYALQQGLPILQPTKLKDQEFLDQLALWEANLFVVVAFRMLPKVVWSMPAHGTFNLHASLLPQYRGAAPINWAIINGEEQTGVTTFFIDEKIDTGAIITHRPIPIAPDETAGSLHDKLMELGASVTLHTLELIRSGQAQPIPQPKVQFKEAPKLNADNTKIDWHQTGQGIDRFIRGLSPYPSAWCILHNGQQELKVKLLGCRYEPYKHNEDLGRIHLENKELFVSVLDGRLAITQMQLPGKKRMPVSELLNGYRFEEGAKFA